MNKGHEEWRLVLEGKGIMIIRNKTVKIVYDFGSNYERIHKAKHTMYISDFACVYEVDIFKCSGSESQKNFRERRKK